MKINRIRKLSKVSTKVKIIYFLVLILVIILGNYLKSLNGGKALIMAVILAFVVFFGAIFLTKKYEYKWGLK